ncbi:MAG TPA: FkbM family methyltransferase [Pyrinomonadaceae bacterium]|nr:FkbM family methyltransferase [Pyrinomonadaceae bacterium]
MQTKTKIFNIFREVLRVPFLERHLRKLSTGKEAESIAARLVPNNYQYPAGSDRTFEYKGIKLSLDIHDYVSHYLYFGFKDRSHEKLMSLVKAGDTVLDVGTNYGSTILQFAKIIAENGRAYGFEPDPVNFAICVKNLGLNTFHHISVENIGLGREEGELTLVVNTESNRGMNRVGVPVDRQEWHKVKMCRLDKWVQQNEIDKIDLIKIDVEGFEMEVLAGARELLKTFSPALFIEIDDNNLRQQGASAKEAVMFLEDYGYSITNSESGNVLSSKDDFSGCHFDIVCVRESC